jgi:hypothetical protein
VAAFTTTLPRRGLEEFFDPTRAPHEPVQVREGGREGGWSGGGGGEGGMGGEVLCRLLLES